MKTRPIWFAAVLALCLQGRLLAAPSVSLLFEARSAAYRATQWLLQRQQEDGSWSHDARLTALGITALCRSGYAKDDKVKQAVARAAAWLPKGKQEPAAQTATAWAQANDRARAFAACEAAGIPLPKSETNWRAALLEKLLGAQRGNGCWQEKNKDSEAATIHALLALSLAGGEKLRQVP